MKKLPTRSPRTTWRAYHRVFSLGALRSHTRTILPLVRRKRGRFVEIGAREGGKKSVSLYLEKGLGWRGLLIEPWPHLYQKCRKRRKHSAALNVAAVDRWLQDSYIEVEGLPPKTSIQQELKKAAMERMMGRTIEAPPPMKRKRRRISYINTDSLDRILRKTDFHSEFDLLILNALGYEENALEGLDFQHFKPRYLLARLKSDELILPNLPRCYELIATSKHDRSTTMILFRHSDWAPKS